MHTTNRCKHKQHDKSLRHKKQKTQTNPKHHIILNNKSIKIITHLHRKKLMLKICICWKSKRIDLLAKCGEEF